MFPSAVAAKSPSRNASFDINDAINELVALTRSEVVNKRVTVQTPLGQKIKTVEKTVSCAFLA